MIGNFINTLFYLGFSRNQVQLQGMELQEKHEHKDEKHVGKLIRNTPKD